MVEIDAEMVNSPSNPVQPLNEWSPKFLTESGMIKGPEKPVHSANALGPM